MIERLLSAFRKMLPRATALYAMLLTLSFLVSSDQIVNGERVFLSLRDSLVWKLFFVIAFLGGAVIGSLFAEIIELRLYRFNTHFRSKPSLNSSMGGN